MAQIFEPSVVWWLADSAAAVYTPGPVHDVRTINRQVDFAYLPTVVSVNGSAGHNKVKSIVLARS